MRTKPYERRCAGGDPTALPAAAGLGLLAVGGWLLTTTRPWAKPGHPVTLGLGWTASTLLLLCGVVLLARCVRTIHEPQAEAPHAEASRSPEPPTSTVTDAS